MKKIECLISHQNFSKVEEALTHLGIRGMTVSEVKGFGNQQTRPRAYLFLPKTKIEIYASDDETERIIETIAELCRTGKSGDGKIAVYDVQELVRIRTGERGEVAV